MPNKAALLLLLLLLPAACMSPYATIEGSHSDGGTTFSTTTSRPLPTTSLETSWASSESGFSEPPPEITSHTTSGLSTQDNSDTTQSSEETTGSSTETGQTDIPECGNLILDFDEVCDDGNKADGDACASDCKTKTALLVFITSTEFSGGIEQYTDIPDDPFPESGIGDAAVQCNRMAKAALDEPSSKNTLLKWRVDSPPYPYSEVGDNLILTSQFLPWLSNEFFSPKEKFKTDCMMPYILTDGKTRIADNFDDLTSTDMNFIKINILETGDESPSQAVWTNTDDRGKIAWDDNNGDCKNWTDSNKTRTGNRGEYNNNNDHEWTIKGPFNHCAHLKRIYCFEQCPTP